MTHTQAQDLRKHFDLKPCKNKTHGFKDGSGSQGYGVCVDGVHIPDDVVKKAVFLYMTRSM